jgi:hypothetical protein
MAYPTRMVVVGRGMRSRSVGAAVGVGTHWVGALLLWFAARALAWRRCLDDAYGLAVEGGGVTATDAGCVVDIPTTQGHLEVVLPTLHSGLVGAAVVVAGLGAIWPLLLLVRHTGTAG